MKKILCVAAVLTAMVSGAVAQSKLVSSRDSVSYAIGLNLGAQFRQQGLDSIDPYLLVQGINDYLGNRQTLLELDQSGRVITTYLQEARKKQEEANKLKAQKNIDASAKFLADNKKRKGVITTASGLQYEIITKGKGALPKATDKVKVHYHGTLLDGRVFDSSVERKEPISFPVNGVIKGWVEALQIMPVGSKWKLYIPNDLAYGTQPMPGSIIEPGMALVFEVELLAIEPAAEQPTK